MVGGGESDYSVCPRPLLQFLQFFQFMSDRLHQVMQDTSGYAGYIRLCQVTSVYVGGTGRGARQYFMIGNCTSVKRSHNMEVLIFMSMGESI